MGAMKKGAKLAVVKPHGFHEVDDSAGDDVRTTISVNGGKQHEMDKHGNVSDECKAELEGVVNRALGKPNRVGGAAVDQLKSIIARVERLEEEKAGICADIRDVFSEAKGSGFDVKAIRKIIKLRKMDANTREEEEAVLHTYMRALDMQLPLFADDAIDNHRVVEIAKKIQDVLVHIVYEQSGVWVTKNHIDTQLAFQLQKLGFIKPSAAASDTWVITDEGKVEALKAKAAR